MISTKAETISDRWARVALAHLVEPGNRELGVLIRSGGPSWAVSRILAAEVSDVLSGCVMSRLAARGINASEAALLAFAENAVAHAERIGARIITPGDGEWPTRCNDLIRISRSQGSSVDHDTDPPVCLWVQGAARVADVCERSVAIVGSRAATDYGNHVATELAHDLACRGWTVISGGAFGIDASAHRGAIAAGGRTVAILASGIDRPYPLANANLFDRITDAGVVVSEWPLGSAPYRSHFLTRNRVIAAATLGTVLVEAAARSGARQTLGRARLLGRPTMAVPGPISSAMSVGCHLELRSPDNRVVTNAEEIIEEVGRIGELAEIPKGEQRPHDVLNPMALRLLDAVLPRKARTAEEIAAAAGVGGVDARRGLPSLVEAGFVTVVEGGYRLTAPRSVSSPRGKGCHRRSDH